MAVMKAPRAFLAAVLLTFQTVYPAAPAFFQGAINSATVACPDTVPVIAAGMGLATCTFFDPMTSLATFDTQATNNAGFNWYTEDVFCAVYFHATIAATVMNVVSVEARAGCQNGGPAATLIAGMAIGQGGTLGAPSAGTQVGTQIDGTTGLTGHYNINNSQTVSSSTPMVASWAQPTSSLSVSAAGLKVAGAGQGFNNYGFGTSAFLTSTTPAASAYHGISFNSGAYTRTYFAFDQTKAVTCTSGTACRWPAIWSTSYNGTAAGAHYDEFDMIDARQAGAGTVGKASFLHDYNTVNGQVDSNFALTTSCTLTLNGIAFNTMDMVWLPSSLFGGAFGIWASIFNADTCLGNAVVMAHMAGNTLTIDSVISGAVGINSFVGGNGVNNGTQITAGSGTSWTVNGAGQTISSEKMIIANGNVCTYYPGATSNNQCSDTPFAGVFAAPETLGDGMNILFSSGCGSSGAATPPTVNQCTGTGEWDLLIKNVQAWQTSIGNKIVK
jgi:hypothetical protein